MNRPDCIESSPPGTPKITLLPNHDAWNFFTSSEISDLIVDRLDHFKRLSGVDGIDEEISVDSNGIFGGEKGIFILRRKVQSDFVCRLAKLTWPALSMISHS